MIVVAGGGLAGASAATVLARVGRDVTLLERTRGPTEKICGEFVSGEAVRMLDRIGLDTQALGGHQVGAVRLIRGARAVESRLPFTALGVSRGRLDEALLAHAARCGVDMRRGCGVARADGTTLTMTDGTTVEASALFLATGKHDLRGLRREATAEDLVGFKMHFALSPIAMAALAGHVEIVVFPDAYVGLQRIEDGRANLCLLVRRGYLDESGGGWNSLLFRMLRESRHLRARLEDARPLLERPLSIFRVPYGFVHAPRAGEVAYRLGDQAAVIPSFAGDGMAIALHSAMLASGVFLNGGDAATYHTRLRRDVGAQVARAWSMYRLGATPFGQAAMMAAARMWPGALRMAAAFTRVSEHAERKAITQNETKKKALFL